MSYLFSHSSSSRPISIPSSNLSAARAQLSAALLSMGFPHARVQPLVALINPTQDNAIEVALELLTREEEDDDDEDEQQQDEELRGQGLRLRPQRAMRRTAGRDADEEDDDALSDAVGVLMVMTGCSAEEATAALHRERDVNAAAEYILQKQEHKEAAAVMTAEQAQREELQRDERRLRRRQRRREKVELYRKIEEEQDSSAGGSGGLRRFLHYGDAVIVQHVQSEEALTMDSESNRVTFTAYSSSSSAALTGASPQHSAASAVITSPLSLPASHHSSSLSRVSPGAALPAPLQLSSLSSSSPPAASRSLLSSSPVRVKAQGSSGGALPPSSSWSSAFLPPSPLRVTSLSSVPPAAAPQASPSSPSAGRLPFAAVHSLSPLHSPIKSRSVSTPRKSSHPLSFSLPSHHRYQLIIRPASGIAAPLAAGEGGAGGEADGDADGGLVMSGDTVVLETYERCFLCLEADGSIGCNRTAPITAQMHFTLHAEHKTGEGGRGGGAEDVEGDDAAKVDAEAGEAERLEAEDDIVAVEQSSLLLLSAVDHHWLGVERQQAVARLSRPSAAHHFSLALAHKPASHHRRHTRSQSSSSPLHGLLPGSAASASASSSSSASAAVPDSGSAHWSYLRRHFRLIALSMLHESIRRKQDLLIAAQRAARLRGEDAKRLCCICLDAQCDAVLLECGHSCACQACAAGLQQCVVCRQRVSRVVAIRAV